MQRTCPARVDEPPANCLSLLSLLRQITPVRSNSSLPHHPNCSRSQVQDQRSMLRGRSKGLGARGQRSKANDHGVKDQRSKVWCQRSRGHGVCVEVKGEGNNRDSKLNSNVQFIQEMRTIARLCRNPCLPSGGGTFLLPVLPDPKLVSWGQGSLE